MNYAQNVREAERLVNKSVDGDTPGHFTTGEDATLRLAWATQAQVHATLALVASQPAQPEPTPPKVWVAVVSYEPTALAPVPVPAVYVSHNEDDLVTIVRKQQGVDYNAELHLWMQNRKRSLHIDSYYVESADD